MDERTDFGVTATMRATAKSKVQSFKDHFSKYAAIANPKHDNEFIETDI
jgi:hypothetical protein